MPPQRRSRRTARALSAQLRRLHAEGRTALGLALAREAFEADVRTRLAQRLERAEIPVDDANLLDVAQRTFGADLFLAIACERRIPGAWEMLIARHGDRLRALLVGHGALPSTAHEIVADLPGLLLTAPPSTERSGRIAGYLGTGTLFSWLATIALRRLARRARERAHAIRTWNAVRSEDVDAAPTGEELAVAAERCDAFRKILAEVLAAMSPRERLALRFRFADGLALREVATVFGVGVPRASRIIDAAVQRLRRVVEARTGGPAWLADGRAAAGLRDELATQLRSVPVRSAVPRDCATRPAPR